MASPSATFLKKLQGVVDDEGEDASVSQMLHSMQEADEYEHNESMGTAEKVIHAAHTVCPPCHTKAKYRDMRCAGASNKHLQDRSHACGEQGVLGDNGVSRTQRSVCGKLAHTGHS